MPLTVASIVLDNVPIPLDTVAADVTIRVGRSTYFDSFTPSTCQLTVIGVSRAFVRGITLGRILSIRYSLDGGAPTPRFFGRTTDASLDGDALTVIAVGKLSTLDTYTVGAVDYPSETWYARMRRVFTESVGLAYLDMVGVIFNAYYLRPRAHATVSLAQYIDELSQMVGAIVSDGLDGLIRIEAPTNRTAASPITVPPDNVLYAPRWEKALPGFNKVSVPYTSPFNGTKTASDAAAIAAYGERAYVVNPSEIQNDFDAQAIADNTVARQAVPRWSTPTATLLAGIVAQVGAAVKLSGLPASAPYGVWTAIVEGWTDNVKAGAGGTLEWTQELALSDPYLSGVVVHTAWIDLPATDKWNTIAAVSWDNADSLA